jgi:uncharacterized protein (TIGR02996 family)
MNDRDAFIAALEKNEDDTSLRMVFADWLDERGEHEEADRHRKWPAAKEWLVKFYEESKAERQRELEAFMADYPQYEGMTLEDDDPQRLDSFRALMNSARECAKDGFDRMYCGNSEWLCDSLRQNRPEFWKHACIYLNVPLPEDIQGKGHFTCGC